MANSNELPVSVIGTKSGFLCTPRYLLIKVISRYLTKPEYRAFEDDLLKYKRITGPLFVESMHRHFNIERWHTSPLIKQDLWLYNYFKFEYKGKLVYTGLLRKYYRSAFIDDDIDFFQNAEGLNQIKTKLPRGVKFIPNEKNPQAANHILSGKNEPRSAREE